jgi:aspartate kinase
MQVLKFGGTSVGSADRIKHVAQLLMDGGRKLVVLSAVAGTTNALAEICRELYNGNKESLEPSIGQLAEQYENLISELYTEESAKNAALELVSNYFNNIRAFGLDMFTPFEEKAILAHGELISTGLLQLYLEEINTESTLISALDFMRIDQRNEPDEWYIKTNLSRILNQTDSKIIITQGFICRNHFGEIDNLKRGGSDYSASIIGAAIHTDEIQIWTDIDGMHNNDPRLVSNTRPIERLTFDEAAELAYFGAKILHPSSILPARKANIPVVLKNTLDPEKKGTIISNESSGNSIKAVAAKDDITAIKIKSDRMLLAHGFLRKVFEVFERHALAIDMITTSEVAVSLTIDTKEDISNLLEELEIYGQVEVDNDQCIICVVGHFLQSEPGHAAKIMDSLKTIPLRMISYGGSKNNVSFLIQKEDKAEALLALNRGLFDL